MTDRAVEAMEVRMHSTRSVVRLAPILLLTRILSIFFDVLEKNVFHGYFSWRVIAVSMLCQGMPWTFYPQPWAPEAIPWRCQGTSCHFVGVDDISKAFMIFNGRSRHFRAFMNCNGLSSERHGCALGFHGTDMRFHDTDCHSMPRTFCKA